MTNKTKLYWTLQLGGWAVYIIINYLSLPLFNASLPFAKLYFVFSFIIGVGLTHCYRYIINSFHWFELPAIKLIRNVFIGALVATISYFLILGLVDTIILLVAQAAGIPYDVKGSVSNEDFVYLYLTLVNFYAVFLLWSVFYFVFQYFENIQKARYQQLMIQTQLKDATLLNLRNQINPHFLFNALNSIKSLTLTETEKARNAITLLSDILRYSLNSEKKPLVTMEEELSVVKDYLELEKIRFGERLNYKIEIGQQYHGVQIPPLLLMTLVENAIKHGISRLKSGGDVLVTATGQDGVLKVEILNTGYLQSTQSRDGIGLKNTQQRLQMLYNQAAEFMIVQKDENTVAATVQIPFNV